MNEEIQKIMTEMVEEIVDMTPTQPDPSVTAPKVTLEDAIKNSSAMAVPLSAIGSGNVAVNDPGPLVEVIPGIMVRQSLIDRVIGETVYPSEIARIEAREAHSRARFADLKKDIEISKRIAGALVESAIITDAQRDAAEEMLCAAMQREHDKRLHFINVTGKDSLSVAKRVLNVKDAHPEDDIEPIDLSCALDDTQPQKETQVTELLPTMHVQKHIDDSDLPAEIRLFIPSVDTPVPSGLQEHPLSYYISPDKAEAGITYQMVRYAHCDSMPPELRNVIAHYLSMRRGDGLFVVKDFKQAVSVLFTLSRDLVDDPQQPAVVPADDASDANDPSHHWRKLAGV
jgi:hypothetical protein